MNEQQPSHAGFERRYDVRDVAAIDREVLGVIDFLYPERRTMVEISHPEFSSVCPWSGLPDYGELIIRYVPRSYCVELKALKYYLHSYRDVGIWQEHVVNRVLDDLVELLNPVEMEIIGKFNVRGGLGTTVSVKFPDSGHE